jgi:hypothetical protein
MSLHRPDTVPYVTAWSSERASNVVVAGAAGSGIGFADELPSDRDEHGVLWRRTPLRQGTGRPEFGKVHALRQRRAMRDLLCQVCGAPADRTEDGVLWLLGEDRADWPGWPERMAATQPPVCLGCARVAVRTCPYLHRVGAVAVRVAAPRVGGVYGALYRPGFPFPVRTDDAIVSYEDPAARWVLAARLVMELDGCTFVDLPD